jgi:hypothetical protein
MVAPGVALAEGGTFNRTLTVAGAPTVTIATDSGSIHVHAGAGSEVRIEAKVSITNGWGFGGGGGSEARVREILAHPPIVQNGSSILIGPGHGDEERYRNIAIDYEVTLPAQATVRATTGSGAIQIADVSAVATASTGSGDIQLHEVGPATDVTTGSGTIRADGVRGAASLETGSGDVELRQEGAGDVKAQSGSGSIRLRGLNGGLRAGTGSGDVEIEGSPASEWRVNTSSGSIRVTVNPAAHFTVQASTDAGTVHVAQAVRMEESLDKQHIVGTVNGGGPTLRLTTSSGDITIR